MTCRMASCLFIPKVPQHSVEPSPARQPHQNSHKKPTWVARKRRVAILCYTLHMASRFRSNHYRGALPIALLNTRSWVRCWYSRVAKMRGTIEHILAEENGNMVACG